MFPDPEMKHFWDSEVFPVITSLVNQCYRLSCIQSRYSENFDAILRRYKKKVRVVMYDRRTKHEARENRLLGFAASTSNECPAVLIFVPDIKAIFHGFQMSHPSNFRQVFQNNVVIAFMHELDHLAYCKKPGRPESFEELVSEECVAWAETCEKTIRWFVEAREEEISFSPIEFYSVWIECEKNTKSRQWIDFITKIYNPFKKIWLEINFSGFCFMV